MIISAFALSLLEKQNFEIKERKSKSKNENEISQKALGSQTWSNWDYLWEFKRIAQNFWKNLRVLDL